MATKISNGELKQENLIQDAMKFASIMPNIFGGAAGGNQSNNRGAGVPDFSNIMSMMSSMMGSGGENDDFTQMFKNMNIPKNKGAKGSKMAVNESALKKIAKAKKLKKKLHEKKKAAAESKDSEVANNSSN